MGEGAEGVSRAAAGRSKTSHQLKLECNSMQGQLMQAQKSLKQKEKEEQRLQGNRNELKQLTEQKKKQIEALQGEIKRCLKGEGKIEKLQTKVLELQRKLDNKTAAVQELGKENQSLQVEWGTHTSFLSSSNLGSILQTKHGSIQKVDGMDDESRGRDGR